MFLVTSFRLCYRPLSLGEEIVIIGLAPTLSDHAIGEYYKHSEVFFIKTDVPLCRAVYVAEDGQ